MNSDLLYNPYLSTACYSSQNQFIYISHNFQITNSNLFHILKVLIQQQNAQMQFPQLNYDWRVQPTNIHTNCKQDVPEIKNIDQNNHLTQVELGFQEKSQLTEEQSQIRINGHWSNEEHLQYLEFVKYHESILKSKYDKKSKKIFKLMSQFIPTRTATQCRSHHQKFNPLIKRKQKQKQSFGQVPAVIPPQS